MQDQRGVTLVEVLVGIGVLALILFMVSPVFLVEAESHRRVIEGSIPALIGESLRDAILVGVRENYDRANNRFFFDFEGVRISIPLPPPAGRAVHLPFDTGQGLYPLGLVYFASDHMVVNGVDLGPLMDGAGNVIRGEFVGLPIDESGIGDLNSNGKPDVPEDVNNNGVLDPGEDQNGDGFLNTPDLRVRIGPYLPYRSDFYRNYGYTLGIVRTSIAPRYEFTIRIFSRFFDVRAGLKSAPYPTLKAYAEPEVGIDATDCLEPPVDQDDDDDTLINDQPVYADKPPGTPSSPCGLHDWRGSPETLLNGIDDDGDGVIDDGVILPSREMKFAIDF